MRMGAIIVLSVAGLFLLAGTLIDAWGSGTYDDLQGDTNKVRWGLRTVTVCEDGGLFFSECRKHSLADAGWDDASTDAGNGTFAIGLLTSLLALILVVLSGIHHASMRAAGVVTLIAHSICLVAAALFIMFLPDEATSLDPELGASFYLFTLGCVGGMLGSSLAARSAPRRRRTGDDGDDERPPLPAHLSEPALPGAPRGAIASPVPIPPPPVEIPQCGQCGQHAVWLHEVRRFSCVRCNQVL